MAKERGGATLRRDGEVIVVSFALVAFAWTGYRIARWEGAVLLAGYANHLYAIWP